MGKKEDLEIKKWGKSLIKRMDKFQTYLYDRLLKLHAEKIENPEILLIIEYKNLLGDLQSFIEIRGL